MPVRFVFIYTIHERIVMCDEHVSAKSMRATAAKHCEIHCRVAMLWLTVFFLGLFLEYIASRRRDGFMNEVVWLHFDEIHILGCGNRVKCCASLDIDGRRGRL